MAWKKVVESAKLLSYEKRRKDFNVRIEASANDKGSWDVYRVYYNQKGLNHVEEFSAPTKTEAHSMVEKLKHDIEPSMMDLAEIQQKKSQPLVLRVKRVYVGGDIEKWQFDLDDVVSSNFVLVRFQEKVHLDIVVHQRYISLERQLIERITETLGLAPDVEWDIFYFGSHKTGDEENLSSEKNPPKTNVVFGRIEFSVLHDDEDDR